MTKKVKSYSAGFKQDAVSRMAHAKTITGLANELGVRRKFFLSLTEPPEGIEGKPTLAGGV
jgi:hypothetical protein